MKNTIIGILSTANILIYSFIGLNYDSFQRIIMYKWYREINTESQGESSKFQNSKGQEQSREIKEYKKEGIEGKNKTLTISSTRTKFSNWEGTLLIPKIQIESKVQHSENASSEDFHSFLTEGAISLTPFIPPSKDGQMIIFGHSSDYLWNNNPYGSLFSLLPELEEGDIIQLTHQRKTFDYEVTHTQITSSDLKPLLKENADSNELILSTCYPIGFFSKRYNVVASPISSR